MRISLMKSTWMHLCRSLPGRGSLLWALALLSACTSTLSLYPAPTEETDPAPGGAGGSAEDGGVDVPEVDPCATVDVSPGLLAHYLFEEDTRDATGHGHDGIPEGAISFIPEGKHGKAI